MRELLEPTAPVWTDGNPRDTNPIRVRRPIDTASAGAASNKTVTQTAEWNGVPGEAPTSRSRSRMNNPCAVRIVGEPPTSLHCASWRAAVP